MCAVEHYKKKQSCYYDDPCAANEIRITGTGKSHDLSVKAAHRLQANPGEGIVISASGNHVTKAVTVVELLKRKLHGLEQITQIKYIRVEDIWDPDIEGLDQLKVTRRIPAISVQLTLSGIQSTDSVTPSSSQGTRRTKNGHAHRERGDGHTKLAEGEKRKRTRKTKSDIVTQQSGELGT